MKKELVHLRQKMKEYGMDAYLVVSDDYHASEYVGDYFKCREYISGFSGSAGTMVVLLDEAGLWTDGRYFIQAESQLAGSGITLYKSGEKNVPVIEEFLREKLPDGAVLGCDGRTVSTGLVKELLHSLRERAVEIKTDRDLIGEIWTERPARLTEPVWLLEECYAGESREDKLAGLRARMSTCRADYMLIPTLDEIAWLLNVRGNDIAYNPVVLSYLMVGQKSAVWYVNAEALSEAVRLELQQAGVTCRDYEAVYRDLEQLDEEVTVLLDESVTNYALYAAIPKAVRKKVMDSPVTQMKSVKNQTEMRNERKAHFKDGIALTKLIYWLKHIADKRSITELDVCDKLEELRKQGTHYLGQSFAPIAAYGEHGAIVHYEPDEASNRTLDNQSFLLLDTGGQYLEGTTDVTRTVALGTLSAEQKRNYTAVLRGNLNLAAAHFKYGCSGVNLDYLAREPLWGYGLDYNHGTGHGVGYLLNVHEGPNAFRCRERKGCGTVMEEGMVTSDEPGLYLEGKYGIRLENLLLCKKSFENEYGTFMEFETLTLVPFDRDAIAWEELNEAEEKRLKDYQRKVYTELADGLLPEERVWLEEQIG